MKVQTSAEISVLSIAGKLLNLAQPKRIELEFSAVDTGGGFRDTILDFSFVISLSRQDALGNLEIGDTCEVHATMQNPDDKGRTASFSCISEPVATGNDELEINGRLKEDQLSREVIGFMLHLMR